MSDPTLEDRAAQMGWVPVDKFRGDPAHWVDAETFVKKGEEVMPLLRANNRRLEEKAEALARANTELKKQLDGINANMGEFLQTQKEILRDKLTRQRAEILEGLKAAREEGDVAKEDTLREQLDQNRDEKKALEAKPVTPPAPPPTDPPEYVAWKSRNEWFDGKGVEEQRQTALAMQFGREAANRGLKGEAFFSYIDEQMQGHLRKEPPAVDKTEGGRPSGQNPSSDSGAKSFKSLPPEAKAHAEKDAARFVGPNKLFKTKEAFQAHFAEQYFMTE